MAASMIVAFGNHTSVGEIVKRIFSSIPFYLYFILRILCVAAIPGNTNEVLVMLMIGIMLELKSDLSELK